MKNTIIVIIIILSLIPITFVTHLVIDSDILYSMWCMITCVIGVIGNEYLGDFVDKMIIKFK